MNVQRLEELRDMVREIPRHKFSQHFWPNIRDGACGCVGFHMVKNEMFDLPSDHGFFGASIRCKLFSITSLEETYIFGQSDDITEVARCLRLCKPRSFGPKSAAKRIQQIIDRGVNNGKS